MGGHLLFFLVLVVAVVAGGAASFAVLAASFKPLVSAMRINTLSQATLPQVRGTPEEEAAWKKLRTDGEASAAPPSRESLEKSRRARADLVAADPGFDPESFLQRAETAYLLIKRALFLGDTAPLRAYVHPSLYALTVAEAERIAASPVRARAVGMTVERVFAQSVESGSAGDRIWVHFDIKTRAQYVDAQAGEVVADMGVSTGFGEQCLFVRNAGLKTVVSGGVFSQKCPACGAPLALNADARCFYCKEEVSTGAHDWTLAAAVPVPYDETDIDVLVDETLLDPVTGFAAIRANDPGFSGDAFEERVMKALVILEAALKTGNLESARALMSPALYLAWSMQAEEARVGGKTPVVETEIFKVAPVAVRHGESFDDVTVRVEGFRAHFVLDERGLLFSGSKERAPFSELWTFQRSTIVTSAGAAGAIAVVCPNCGAPFSVTGAGQCVHCNATITNGAPDWVLSRIVEGDLESSLVRAGAT